MKLLNKKQKNNAGFSLVELIVVIAIMVVLVAVLAPLFSKYIESSRRSTDVQNANSISEGVLADYADGQVFKEGTKYTVSGTAPNRTATGVSVKGLPTAVGEDLKTKGNALGDAGKTFTFTYTEADNKCKVTVTDGSEELDLTTEDGAKAYKDK